jgi:hypothetical protein
MQYLPIKRNLLHLWKRKHYRLVRINQHRTKALRLPNNFVRRRPVKQNVTCCKRNSRKAKRVQTKHWGLIETWPAEAKSPKNLPKSF